MNEHLRLIQRKIEHLRRMQEYLAYSVRQVAAITRIDDWPALSADQHESLAAFRVRFSEFQEHLGKLMRAIAMEEEQNIDRFGAVLAFMERLEIIDSGEHWKLIRELRNAVNHEYDENTDRLRSFFTLLLEETTSLTGWFGRLQDYCAAAYPELWKELGRGE